MAPLDPSQPFVLLDDARQRQAGASRLYRDPRRIIAVRAPGDVGEALERIRQGVASGLHAAGYLAYEAGLALEPRLAGRARPVPEDAAPLLWFGLFGQVELLAPEEVPALLPDPTGAFAGGAIPRMDGTTYARQVARIADYIAAGDIYQANLTFAADVPVAGAPLALHALLRQSGGGGWGGVVFTGAHWLLSFSPELFFTLSGGMLTARPMKGTIARAPDGESDAALAERLRTEPKERAENLMIVDLLRNDLARVAVPGSVSVPALFEIEQYPTVHQMTSTVTARLAQGNDAIDVLGAIFPCGSITGAPKIRAMEILDEVEGGPRGPYTGSIGHIAPEGDAAFNVAIRTLELDHRPDGQAPALATLRIGSGIVADSRADAEWRECLAKADFTTRAARLPDLIETMRFDAREGIVALERHLSRMKDSAAALGYRFDRHDTRNELQAATFRLREDRRVRLLLSPSGAVAVEIGPVPPVPADPVEVTIVPVPVSRRDYRLRHKTSDRRFYDDARKATGAFEVMFVDYDGYLTEGSFTTLFVERDGVLLTPPLSRGLLPGTLRGLLIEEGRAIEAELTPADLEGGFLIGNALRGLMVARLARPGL